MTKKELIVELKKCAEASTFDAEEAHRDADKALLIFIDDIEIADAYKSIRRWYA